MYYPLGSIQGTREIKYQVLEFLHYWAIEATSNLAQVLFGAADAAANDSHDSYGSYASMLCPSRWPRLRLCVL